MDQAHELYRSTGGWGASEWIAFGMLVVAVLGMMAGGIVALAKAAHQFGRHDERLKQAETQIKELREADKTADIDRQDVAVLTAIVTRIEAGVNNLTGDLNRRMEHLEGDIRRYLARREDRP